MIGIIVAVVAAVILTYIFLALLFGVHMKSVNTPPPACAQVGPNPAPSVLDLKKIEVEGVEREVFAKADLIQKLVKGLAPMNGSTAKPKTRPVEAVDPELHPPDETGYLKAITDKVEQIKRLSTKK